MPVRSLNSSVLRWPEAKVVGDIALSWATRLARVRPDILHVGYVGSYARGDWGVGSDLDLIVVLDKSSQPLERRSAEFDLCDFPVPVDLLVYTSSEWDALMSEAGCFSTMLQKETHWLFERAPSK